MFNIGDNILYPMQGIGLIEGIEEKNISGKIQKYYIINILSKKMNIMVPLSKGLASGIRSIVDEATLDKALLVFNGKNSFTNQSLSYKERYQINMNKIKTGTLSDEVEVIHDLTMINNEKALNTTEKQMLTSAKKTLIDEIALIKGISEIQADKFLTFTLAN